MEAITPHEEGDAVDVRIARAANIEGDGTAVTDFESVYRSERTSVVRVWDACVAEVRAALGGSDG